MPSTRNSPTLDRLLQWSLAHPLPAPRRYVVATLVVLAVGAFRALVVTSLMPWLLFEPFVLAIGLMLGRHPGIYASLLAAAVAGVSIGSPAEPLFLSRGQWAGTLLFVAVSIAIALFAAELRAAFARAQRLVAEKERAVAQLAEREAFLSSVLGSSTDCIKVLDLDGRLNFMSEGGRKVMEVSDFNAIAGCPWPDFWSDSGNADARAALAAAREGRTAGFVGCAATMGGRMRWWDVAVSPIPGPDGRPERILAVSRDITASREQEEQLRRLARVIENSADFIGMAGLDGRVFFLNQAACALVGLSPEDAAAHSIADFFPPDEAATVMNEVLPAVVRDGNWSGERLFRHFRTGELIPVLYTVFPVLDPAGEMVGYGTVTRDFRERKRAEERQQLLNNELSHRLKNVLTVVQSVAAQTLRQAADLPSASLALSARLAALGEATNVLTARDWTSADLHELVGRVLAPHGAPGERIVASGPSIRLHAQVALALALALHELATNAAKYGALSDAGGRVSLDWWVADAADGTGPRFRLRWRETGGPPVAAPGRRGFGSMMIERSLRSYFRGEAAIDYRPGGLVFNLDAPLGEAGVMNG